MSGYTLAVSDESDNSIQYMDVTPAPGAVAETRAPLVRRSAKHTNTMPHRTTPHRTAPEATEARSKCECACSCVHVCVCVTAQIGIGRAIPPIPFVSNKGMEGIAPYK